MNYNNATMANTVEQFEYYVHRVFEDYSTSQSLIRALQYAVLGGGKRIRPCLLIESCLACGGAIEQALPSAAAIELIHAYSLVHDDLPCMDNDDLRRGRPTLHKAFSEAIALLAGDALIPIAFGLIAKPNSLVSFETQLKVIQLLSEVAGIGKDGQSGLVSGQAFDILATQGALPMNEETLSQIHSGKTGALFRFALKAGALLAGANENIISLFEELGLQVGLIFQIQDDLLDITATTEVLGKTAGKDNEQNKLTFPGIFGIDGSEQILQTHLDRLNGILVTIENQLTDSTLLLALRYRIDTMLKRCS